MSNVIDPTAQYEECIALIKEHMNWDDEKAHHWMNTDNPMFGNVSPVLLINRFRGHKVLSFIKSCIDESKPPEQS